MKFFKNLIQARRMNFDQLGVFVLVLMIVVWFGFGPSYFERIVGHAPGFSFYFHFHAFCMVVWLLTVFVQPILIRRGMIKEHRQVGKLSYGLFPVMIISILLLIHSQLNEAKGAIGGDFFVPFKDVVIMVFSYIFGIYWRSNVAVHSRFMIASMIPMIEPALVRMFVNSLPVGIVDYSYLLTILVVDTTILSLAIKDLSNGRLKWIFLSLLIVMILFQAMILLGITEVEWMVFLAKWYASIGR